MIHNFNAGPSILPKEVFEEASNAVLNFNDTGLSILEIGHRTPLFQQVMEEARTLVRELMDLDKDQEVLFLHGGATTQFMQVPMNLLDADQTASYTDTGTWSVKAIKEARHFGHVEISGSSAGDQYRSMPEKLQLASSSAYLHITTNETIAGTQWQQIPFYDGVPLVADMSSDIMSREMDFRKFGLIYAGAQKNLGAAGVNLVVVNKNILGKISRSIPSIMDYRKHIEAESMLNTPPVFAVYVAMLNLRWLKKQGGVSAIQQINERKAGSLYQVLDQSSLFKPLVSAPHRSRMNVVFVIEHPVLEKEFLALCEQEGIRGIKGHRSVGGFRVSLYNALPLESVQFLTGLMTAFEKSKS